MVAGHWLWILDLIAESKCETIKKSNLRLLKAILITGHQLWVLGFIAENKGETIKKSRVQARAHSSNPSSSNEGARTGQLILRSCLRP